MVQCFRCLVLAAVVAGASAQCGPNEDMPIPPGESECPPAPDDQQGGPPPDGGDQSGGGSSGVTCDAAGGSASYNETIGTGSTKSREITSNGCPNHYSYCTGKNGMGVCGGVGMKGSDTEAVEQTKSLTLPAEPVLRASYGIGVSGSDVQCQLGAIGIALNGVSIYGGAVDQACTPIDVSSIQSEWESFDCCSGHSQRDGDYHYHFPPSCLIYQIGDFDDGHSPQIGWAYDGFPIYGPKGPGGIDMKFGGALGPCTGQYCLDECSGLELEIAAIDGFKYRYYIVGATSDLSMLPTNPKPSAAAAAQFSDGKRGFTPNCYRGYTYTELTGGSSGTTGVGSGYTAAANAGVSEKYAPANLCAGGGFSDVSSAINGFCSETNASSCSPNFGGIGPAAPPSPSPPSPPSPSPSGSQQGGSPTPTPTPSSSTDADAAAAVGGAFGVLALVVALPCLEIF